MEARSAGRVRQKLWRGRGHAARRGTDPGCFAFRARVVQGRGRGRRRTPWYWAPSMADGLAVLARLDPMKPAERSRQMALVRSKDTTPELNVRRAVRQLGYRYRLHGKGVPGHPDIVLVAAKRAIFVHGCFWHRHRGCRRTHTPKN